MTDYSVIIDKVLSDEGFADRLVASPEQTLRDNGVEPSTEVLSALQGMNAEAVSNLAKAFGKDQAAS